MAQGIKALQLVEMGVEATPGGSTDPTSTVWRGMGALKNDLAVTFADENIGIHSGVDRTYIAKTGGSIQMTGEATYEQIPYIFGAGIANVTATTDTGSGYIRTYTFPTTDARSDTDLATLVLIGGDNAGAEIMRYCFVESFSLDGAAGASLKVNATTRGRTIAPSAYTGGLSIPTVEEILFSKAKLYIDVSSDNFGTTQVSNTLLSATLDVKTGWQGVMTADGRTDFSFVKQVMPEITLKVVFEHNTSSIAEKAAWLAQTSRNLQLKFEGNTLTSAGTYTYKTLIVNLAGKWESFDALTDQDGNDTVSGTFRARYNATAAMFARFIVVNDLSSLP